MNKGTNRGIAFIAAGAVLAVVYAAWPVSILEVSLPKEGARVLMEIQVRTGDPVLFQYRHSVELIQVEGLFSIGPESGLNAVETRFESTGTGLPDSFPERTTRRDGWWVVNEMNRPVGDFRFYIVPINNPRLTVAGQPIPIADLESGTLVQLKVYRLSRFTWMMRKIGTEI